jgi:type IV secretory pathway VirB2 component (pilin)
MWASLALLIAVRNLWRGIEMKNRWMVFNCWLRSTRVVLSSLVALCLAAPALAQTGNSPWENAVNVLQQAFTSTIARGLSLVANVVSGLTFAFGRLNPISAIRLMS